MAIQSKVTRGRYVLHMDLVPGDMVMKHGDATLIYLQVWPIVIYLQVWPIDRDWLVCEFNRDQVALVVAVNWVQMAPEFGGNFALLLYKHRLGWTLAGNCQRVSGDPATHRDE